MTRKTLERILIPRTIIALDDGKGVHAATIADYEGAVRDHELLKPLPPISRKGIGRKLSAMARELLVEATYDSDQRLHRWSVRQMGLDLARSIGGLPGDA